MNQEGEERLNGCWQQTQALVGTFWGGGWFGLEGGIIGNSVCKILMIYRERISFIVQNKTYQNLELTEGVLTCRGPVGLWEVGCKGGFKGEMGVRVEDGRVSEVVPTKPCWSQGS